MTDELPNLSKTSNWYSIQQPMTYKENEMCCIHIFLAIEHIKMDHFTKTSRESRLIQSNKQHAHLLDMNKSIIMKIMEIIINDNHKNFESALTSIFK